MSNKDNGGPAYPCTERKTVRYMDEAGYGREKEVYVIAGGMTLRDYFAGEALEGLLSGNPPSEKDAREFGGMPSLVARGAYMMADAMLAERAK